MVSDKVNRTNWVIGLLLILASVSLTSCDNDSKNGRFDVTFYSDSDTLDDNTVTLQMVEYTDDLLVLSVDVNNITNGAIHSIFFDMVFRSEILQYTGYGIGNLLEGSGSVSYMVAPDSQDADRLIAGIALVGNTALSNGDGVAIYLFFKPIHAGNCPFRFENAWMKDNNGASGRPITGISWYGGEAGVSLY